MASRKLEDLHPWMQGKAKEFIDKCRAEGHKIVITCTARSYQEQVALYSQGRNPIEITNGYRNLAGLPPIDEETNKRKITWTMNSKHIVNLMDDSPDNDLSRAFDFVVDTGNGLSWDIKVDANADGLADYDEIGVIGESLGLVWGGRWKNPDKPHFQMPDNIT
jgi:peptidoglycan LD-endopeptidase CwlK